MSALIVGGLAGVQSIQQRRFCWHNPAESELAEYFLAMRRRASSSPGCLSGRVSMNRVQPNSWICLQVKHRALYHMGAAAGRRNLERDHNRSNSSSSVTRRRSSRNDGPDVLSAHGPLFFPPLHLHNFFFSRPCGSFQVWSRLSGS